MSDNFVFKRENLAVAYCDSLAGKGIANATSGLFLAAPRRVGKSTFLIEDLVPEAQKRQWLTVYVDLWANKLINPASLIMDAIKARISAQKGKFGKLAKRIQLQKINILQTVELGISKTELLDNITIVDLLTELIRLSRKPVVLIIDEAQQALATTQGINTMFSIKSARDQINIASKSSALMLVMTGSNRDKLAQLIIKKDQPFFGSDVTTFPLLGREYTDLFTEKVNKSLARDNQFNKKDMWEAFQMIGYRPEVLRQIAGQVALNHETHSFSDLLKQDANTWHNQIWMEFENGFNTLSPLQRAILILLIEKGREWSPFSEESMRYYQQATNHSTLSVSTVQTTIQSLREQGYIWQSSRGAYALEDDNFAQWYRHIHFPDKHVDSNLGCPKPP